jgi:hypothetical protein
MFATESKPLRGKTCLVTGGARRLGRASALALAQAGADVAITFRNSAREAQHTVVDLSSLGVRAFSLKCDVTDETNVKSMMKEVGRELGRIDVLVNNAANYATADFEQLTLREWDAICFEYPRTVPGVAGGLKVDAPKITRIGALKINRGKNYPYGFPRRAPPLGYACPLLFL